MHLYRFVLSFAASLSVAMGAFHRAVESFVLSLTSLVALAFPPPVLGLPTTLARVDTVGLSRRRHFKVRLLAREPSYDATASVRAFAA